MGNKRNKKKQKQSKRQYRCFRGNQFVDSDGKEHVDITTKRARPSRSVTPSETPTKKQRLARENADDERNFNIIVKFGLLTELLMKLCQCPECSERVVIEQNKKFGFAVCFSISCCMCDWRVEFNTSKN